MIRSILFEKGGQFILVGERRTATTAAGKKVFTSENNALIAGNSFFLSFVARRAFKRDRSQLTTFSFRDS